MNTLESLMTKDEIDAFMVVSSFDYIGTIPPYLIYGNGYDRIAIQETLTPKGLTYKFKSNYRSPKYHTHSKCVDKVTKNDKIHYDIWINEVK